jgi:hypothetical protein
MSGLIKPSEKEMEQRSKEKQEMLKHQQQAYLAAVKEAKKKTDTDWVMVSAAPASALIKDTLKRRKGDKRKTRKKRGGLKRFREWVVENTEASINRFTNSNLPESGIGFHNMIRTMKSGEMDGGFWVVEWSLDRPKDDEYEHFHLAWTDDDTEALDLIRFVDRPIAVGGGKKRKRKTKRKKRKKKKKKTRRKRKRRKKKSRKKTRKKRGGDGACQKLNLEEYAITKENYNKSANKGFTNPLLNDMEHIHRTLNRSQNPWHNEVEVQKLVQKTKKACEEKEDCDWRPDGKNGANNCMSICESKDKNDEDTCLPRDKCAYNAVEKKCQDKRGVKFPDFYLNNHRYYAKQLRERTRKKQNLTQFNKTDKDRTSPTSISDLKLKSSSPPLKRPKTV